ncbi:hypothetical protein [Anaerofustis stercorihominis]|uniref:hypothetical protein n=1 Tax=Anaerofustis stercorihominis TaxID=214853 RepID=UPI00214BA4BA|nr:hypothetical protein [Anaerofustis stercorihominis]MCR2033712.1 hypothetical protein [Anaerofustis stercorihominis]
MRDLKSNQQEIYYSLKFKKDNETDKFGNPIYGYTEPILYEINISAGTGEGISDVFGKKIIYDKEMVTHDLSCPIDEYSELWIDIPNTEKSNAKVVKRAKTKNCIRYAIKIDNV